jgi:hypothetical protein
MAWQQPNGDRANSRSGGVFPSLRKTRMRTYVLVSGALFAASLTGCTDAKSKETSAESVAATAADTGTPTIAPLGTEALPTIASTTTSSTSSTIPTTTLPPTTIPHGEGVAANLITGEPYDEDALNTARSVYEAAITHNYDRLRDIIGDRRFRWGFIGERKPTEAWQKEFDEGGADQLARIAQVLETPPGLDDRGEVVWPYLALKDPKDWTAEDEALLAKLGFNPEDIASTKVKGRYVDTRLIIDATGIWNTFAVAY